METKQVYYKACKVIQSCRNEIQLKGARNYVNLFLGKYKGDKDLPRYRRGLEFILMSQSTLLKK